MRKDIQAHFSNKGDRKTVNGSSPVLKVASPSSVASRRSILGQLKTVICSSHVKWETGPQVSHRVREIKDDGRNTVSRRWVVVRERLDPTATFLLLVDKGTLTYTLIFPFTFCALYLFLYSVFHLPPPIFARAVQQRGECGLLSLPEVPYKSVRFVLYICANLFVCVAFTPVAHLSHLWRNMVAARSMAS